MPSRLMNKGRSNDHDFVPPTQYSRTKQPLPSLLSQLKIIPEFEAMRLENSQGSSQNLHAIDSSNPEDLQELSVNSVRINQNGEKSRRPRPPRTRYGCSVCQIHLCQEGTCWEEHTQLSKLE